MTEMDHKKDHLRGGALPHKQSPIFRGTLAPQGFQGRVNVNVDEFRLRSNVYVDSTKLRKVESRLFSIFSDFNTSTAVIEANSTTSSPGRPQVPLDGLDIDRTRWPNGHLYSNASTCPSPHMSHKVSANTHQSIGSTPIRYEGEHLRAFGHVQLNRTVG